MSLQQDLQFEKICRLCMSKDKVLISIFASQYNSNLLFSDMVMSMSTVKITTEDPLPKCICLKCIDKILKAYSLKIECEKSEKVLYDCVEKNIQATNNKIEKLSQIGKKRIYDSDILSEDLNQVISEKPNEEATSQTSSANIFKCLYCDHAVLTEATLKKHTASKHYREKEKKSINNTQRKPVNQCCFCSYVFENKQHLKMHLVAKHLPKANNNYEKQTSGTCYLCGLESKNISLHLNEHFKHLYCNKCKMKFDDRQQFESHMKEEMSASTSTNLSCNESNRKHFKTDNTTLVQNKTTIDYYQCPSCAKLYSTHSSLKRHLRVHMKCMTCKTTRNSKHLCLHEHMHKYSKDCNQSFERSSHLRHH